MAVKEIKLKVAEAIQDDVNKGIVRIDSSYMHQIDVRPGDIVEIEGERLSVGIADRAYPGDIGLNIIRLDGLLRRNARTSIGELTTVRKAEVQEAQKVVIAPAKQGVMIRASPIIFKQGLLGRAVMKGDLVSLGGTRRRRSAMTSSPFFDEVFNMLDENMIGFGLGDLRFIVASSDPKGAVIISENTRVDFNPEAVEVEEKGLPEVTYEDIGGLEDEVKKVREMIELPLKYPEIFERLGIEPPKGVLLHGPPGTGKTLLAKAVASETNSNFYLINGPEIMSKYYGQSEENLRKKFEEAEKNAPSIIFIDEIDAIASKREESKGEVERRVVAQLLAIMDGLKNRGRVVVIAATNIPNSLDPALRRPGRFDREIEIGVPSQAGRLNILKIHSRNMPIDTTLQNNGISESPDDVRDRISNKFADVQIQEIVDKVLTLKKDDTINAQERKQLIINTISDALHRNVDRINLSKQFLHQVDRIVARELYSASVMRTNAQEMQQAMNQHLQDLRKDDRLDEIIDDAVREMILSQVADVTHGFVGADLAALTRESAMIVLRKILPDLDLQSDDSLPREVIEKLRITHEDMTEALKSVRPSALREVFIEVPKVTWEDVGGLSAVKQELVEAVDWPISRREVFTRLGIKPPKGVLLYGPPGTGKTLLAKAVANQSQANFILVKGPELLSKWVGESERAVREIFQKARQSAPTIIFFDEIDSLAPRRGTGGDNNVTERLVNQLLTEIDGLQELNDIVIVGSTNRPDILDPALLRPGRFDRMVLVPTPDQKAREAIIDIHTQEINIDYSSKVSGVQIAGDDGSSRRKAFLKWLAEKTDGYVGADIEAVAREAALLAVRDNPDVTQVELMYFEKALDKVKPSVTAEVEKAYEDLQKNFRRARADEVTGKQSYYG